MRDQRYTTFEIQGTIEAFYFTPSPPIAVLRLADGRTFNLVGMEVNPRWRAGMKGLARYISTPSRGYWTFEPDEPISLTCLKCGHVFDADGIPCPACGGGAGYIESED